MALYNPENFINDMQDHPELNLSRNESKDLCNLILNMEISEGMTWSEFNDLLRNTLKEYFVNVKSDYQIPELNSDIGLIEIPDIAEINSYEEIINYLDIIKGKKIEENLKRFFLRSQLNDEEHNHFALLFYKFSDMSPKQNKAFRCLYSELLLTQIITRQMLDWIILTFSKNCKCGINANIEKPLSSGEENFYIKLNDRISFLRLIFAITIVSPDDEAQEAIDQSKNILLPVLGRDDYNPRSFVEMCYYYAIVNMLSIQELEKLLRNTAVNIVMNLFSDAISDLKKEKVEEYIVIKSLSLIEGFLDFRKYSVKFCIPIVQKFNLELSSDDIEKIIENKLNEMNVNYFSGNILRRDTCTYEYYLNEIEPRVNMYSTEYCNEDEFSEWMARHRRFYEGYYGIESFTRSINYGILDESYSNESMDASDVEQYASEIVYNNTLEQFKIDGSKRFGKLEWKKELFALPTRQERIMQMKRIFEKLAELINKYDGDKEKFVTARVYLEVDRNALIEAVIDRLEIDMLDDKEHNSKITREKYLLKKFKEFVVSKMSASEFELELSYDEEEEDSEMKQMRWAEFNPMRYQDAMLYMCLNCNEPNDMFEKINSTPGYSYYDN